MHATPLTPHDDGEPRRHRRLPRRRTLAVAATGVAIGLLAQPVASWAGLDLPFTDVPVSHSFYEEIRWAYGAGVVTGYPDNTYKPGNPVTRGAMTAYLMRLHELSPRAAYNHTAYHATSSTAWATIPGLTATVVVPDGLTVEAQIVAHFSAEAHTAGAGTGHVRMLINGTEMVPIVANGAVFVADTSPGAHSLERFAFVEPGAYTVTVQTRVSDALTTMTLKSSTLSAQSFPVT